MISKRQDQFNHTQIKLNFSSLNFHLYQRHCINSPNCSCGDTFETPHHCFFLRPQFTQQRNILFQKRKIIIPDQQQFSTQLLLFGSELFDNCNNRCA